MNEVETPPGGGAQRLPPANVHEPSGFLSAEPQTRLAVYCKMDNPAPAGLGECEFLGYITRSPDVEMFDPADGGKIVHYMERWVNKRGAKGPISETVSATVPA